MNMKTHLIIPIFLLLFMAGQQACAQEVRELSLKDAIEYAKENSFDLLNARTDIEIARKMVKETTATGLPQINAGLSYNNYPSIPTQLIPDFLSPVVYGVLAQEGLIEDVPAGVSDQLFEAQFGTKHNLTAQVTLSQLIFNGPYIVGLQAARAFVDFSVVQEKKLRIETEALVRNAYYRVLVTQRSLDLLDSTRATLEESLAETREIFQEGLIEETDVDQIELALVGLESNLTNTTNNLNSALRGLKYLIGMPEDQELRLTDDLATMLAALDRDVLMNENLDPEAHIDMEVVRNQRLLNELDLKRYRSLYLPSLSGFYNYQEVAQRQKFDFLESGKDWFPTEVIGIQLDIPLWSSGSRSSRVQQAKLQLEKTDILAEKTRAMLMMNASNAKGDLENAWKTLQSAEKNMELSEKIYERTRIRYSEGMSSSLALQQTYRQYLEAEGGYIQSLMSLLSAKTAFDKAFQKI